MHNQLTTAEKKILKDSVRAIDAYDSPKITFLAAFGPSLILVGVAIMVALFMTGCTSSANEARIRVGTCLSHLSDPSSRYIVTKSSGDLVTLGFYSYAFGGDYKLETKSKISSNYTKAECPATLLHLSGIR